MPILYTFRGDGSYIVTFKASLTNYEVQLFTQDGLFNACPLEYSIQVHSLAKASNHFTHSLPRFSQLNTLDTL